MKAIGMKSLLDFEICLELSRIKLESNGDIVGYIEKEFSRRITDDAEKLGAYYHSAAARAVSQEAIDEFCDEHNLMPMNLQKWLVFYANTFSFGINAPVRDFFLSYDIAVHKAQNALEIDAELNAVEEQLNNSQQFNALDMISNCKRKN